MFAPLRSQLHLRSLNLYLHPQEAQTCLQCERPV